MSRKKILLLTTGGTIASLPTAQGLAPEVDGEGIRAGMDLTVTEYEVTVQDLLHLDSSNMQPEEWQFIARTIDAVRGEYDGIVITHGTDTMSYTAAALSFMLLGISIPVVLTGSQLPLAHPLTDAPGNLRTAFAMAASGCGGIFVAFDRRVILGTRAVKTHTMDFGAFESVNSPCVATVNARGLCINPDQLPPPVQYTLRQELCRDVFLVKLTPGLDPKVFDMLFQMRYRGIVIEAFGAGGLHFIRRDLIQKLQEAARHNISVVVCSQCLYERSDFSLYEVGRRALQTGVIESFDMTTEAAVTKLMWALGQDDDRAQVAALFARSLAGEITLPAQYQKKQINA